MARSPMPWKRTTGSLSWERTSADPEDGGVVGVTKGLSSRFGEHRVRSTPISEQAIIGAAIGASLVGWKPVAEIMLMNFTAVAMDMIVNHAAKLRYMSGGQTHVPITIRTMTGAGIGNGGQHSDYLEAWFAHTAGIKVIAPSNPADAYGLLRSCIDDPDPCLFIENLPGYWAPGEAPTKGHRVPLGKAKIVREGSDVTVISYSRMMVEAINALKLADQKGISVELIDLRSISPWDQTAVVNSAAKTGTRPDRPRGRDSLRGRRRNREHAVRGVVRPAQEAGDAARRRVFAGAFLEASGSGARPQCGAHSGRDSSARRWLISSRAEARARLHAGVVHPRCTSLSATRLDSRSPNNRFDGVSIMDITRRQRHVLYGQTIVPVQAKK